MIFSETPIKDVWIGKSQVHIDARGSFQEWFKSSSLPARENFNPQQANTSISRKGVIRGIHYSLAPNGQSKLVTCSSGAIRDFFVDLRQESETFLQWGFQDLDPQSGLCVYLGSGIGHAFQAYEDLTAVTYLLDNEYRPTLEIAVNPFDQRLKIDWPLENFQLSKKDKFAPSIEELITLGKLPN